MHTSLVAMRCWTSMQSSTCCHAIKWKIWVRKKGATPLCCPPSLRHPPLPPHTPDSKKAQRPYYQRVGQIITLPANWPGFPPKAYGNMPVLGLLSGRAPVIWGRIKGGTWTDPRPYRPRPRWKFPSTLTNLNRTSRKKRPALDQDL